MSTSLQNILVPTDFSKEGHRAVRVAASLCSAHGATLHLLHALDNRHLAETPEPDLALTLMQQEMEKEGIRQLESLYESLLLNDQLQVHIHMSSGDPSEEITREAEELPADLVVIGTHGISGMKEFFLGTTSFHVIKNTTLPVLTIPPDFQKTQFKKILFPVRPMQDVQSKYELIKPFLREPGVHVHVAELEVIGHPQPADEAERVIDLLKDAGISCSASQYPCSNFARKVIELSESLEVDLIAINATTDTKWTQFFSGPYAQQVVNHSLVPVLSFRTSGADKMAGGRKKASNGNPAVYIL